MAAWMSALALVPWGDVIKATPRILQAARKLLGNAGRGAAPAQPGAGSNPALLPVDAQLQQLHSQITQLEQGQRDGVMLIESLAEQNARLVQAIEALRRHSQRTTWTLLVLGALCLGLLTWVLRQP